MARIGISSESIGGGHGHGVGLMPKVFGSIGVVFGDIGTSPLYTIKECFTGHHALSVNSINVLGVASLIVWSLIVVISIKYFFFIMKADNRGEGGILSLLALTINKTKKMKLDVVLVTLGLFGAALLFGDAVITPAISVLSAVEGLTVATNYFEPYILPITITIIVMLFLIQRKGTHKVGFFFAPVLVTWFLSLGALGLLSVVKNPFVLNAFNPYHAFNFFQENKLQSFYALSSVFLAVTGGEALYADMGHFGKKPMSIAWFSLVLPCLMLNYLGQSALVLSTPEAAKNPFYNLAPEWALYPLVVLATMSAAVASQAVITGIYSVARQAVQLGYCPRLKIVHTSESEIGQIYVPTINTILAVTTIWLVLEFRSSSALAAAYGIAVASTMVITTLLAVVVTRRLWGWPWWASAGIFVLFVPVDFLFFSANIIKIPQGGWFPLLMAVLIYTIMTTWHRGRQILAQRMRDETMPFQEFLDRIAVKPPARVPGIALFMTSDAMVTPPALLHNVEHNKVLHERLVFLTIKSDVIPRVPQEKRVRIESMPHSDFIRVVAKYGFMENPSIQDILEACRLQGHDLPLERIAFFLGRETLVANSSRAGLPMWRKGLFAVLSRNAQRATAYFQIPSNQVVEIGIQIDL